MKRVQRKRTRGWRMPPNTVYVGRPSRWGNPFKIGRDGSLEDVIRDYRALIAHMAPSAREYYLAPLIGKDLACWCPLDKPCHADILLEFLREEAGKP